MFDANEARKLTETARYAQSEEAKEILNAIKAAASDGKDKTSFVISDTAAVKRIEHLLILRGFRLVCSQPCSITQIDVYW